MRLEQQPPASELHHRGRDRGCYVAEPDPAAFFQDDERKNKLDGAEPNKARLLIISYMMKDIVDAPAEEPEEEKTPEFVPTYELVKAVVS